MYVKSGLAVAAILIGTALGFVLAVTLFELRAENARQAQTNQRLQEQIDRLRAQINVTPSAGGLEGQLVTPCRNDECLVEMSDGYSSYLVGVGKLVGYFERVQREAWGETKDCDTLVVTGGSEPLVKYFVDLVERGNTVNSLNSALQLQFNLELDRLRWEDRQKILNSTKENPIEIVVLIPLPGGKDAPVCFSFAEILKIK